MQSKYSDASLERILGLEFGSLKTWRSQGFPPEAETLFKILKLFPWMLEVADKEYDQNKANNVMEAEAFSKVFEKVESYKGFLVEC